MAKDQITPVRRDIILALADCRMRAYAVGKKLYMDHSTVLYHMKIIKSITGLDPKNFYDLYKLVEMVNKGEENDRVWRY